MALLLATHLSYGEGRPAMLLAAPTSGSRGRTPLGAGAGGGGQRKGGDACTRRAVATGVGFGGGGEFRLYIGAYSWLILAMDDDRWAPPRWVKRVSQAGLFWWEHSS